MVSLKIKSDSNERFEVRILVANKVLRLTHDEVNRELPIPVYILTSVGKDLGRLVKRADDPEFVLEVAKYIHSQGYQVEMADVTDWLPERVRHGDFAGIEGLS